MFTSANRPRANQPRAYRQAIFALLLCLPTLSFGQGMMIPVNRQYQPMEITYQRVNVTIRDQAAQTRVEQEFINHQSVPLEAEYLFPLPAGATVNDFAMWVDGKRMKAEMVEAKKARQIYQDIVQRTKDPGLLEQLGNNLWRMKVFPVPAQGRQKVEISFASIAKREGDLAEYLYPLKAGNQSVRTRDDFTMRIELHSSTPIKSIYSPSHNVGINREGDHKAIIGFESRRYALDKDFQLFWTASDKDVGVSLLTFAEGSGSEPGTFMLLISPKHVMTQTERLPRDIVFVLDTSGSMQGKAIEQAKKALEFCVKSLSAKDRFAILGFSTTTNAFAPALKSADQATISQATDWIRNLQAVGGTAIDDALKAGLGYRPSDARNFTVVFLTDGLPTIGETDPKKILANVKQSAGDTRFFTFGVGNDVNTHLLDILADNNRGTSVYVRPEEDLEVKMSALFAKISMPVMSDLALSFTNSSIRITDMFPPKLPDLFHGNQLVVLGRYAGTGSTAIKLSGKVGANTKEIVHEGMFSNERKGTEFLPALWARRKVGYLLDQIRLNGETKELVDETIALSKRFGIVTPYTSYLAVPDQPMVAGVPVIRGRTPLSSSSAPSGVSPMSGMPAPGRPGRELSARGATPSGGGFGIQGGTQGQSVPTFTSGVPTDRFGLGQGGGMGGLGGQPADGSRSAGGGRRLNELARTEDAAGANVRFMERAGKDVSGQSAVDYADALRELKDSRGDAEQGKAENEKKAAVNESRKKLALESKRIGKTQFVRYGDLWIDSSITDDSKPIKIKYLGAAYFKLLDKNDELKKILALGKRVGFKTPSGAVILIDQDGADEMPEAELTKLFTPAK